MTLSAYFARKSVFDVQGCRALTLALVRLSCYIYDLRCCRTAIILAATELAELATLLLVGG